MKHTVILISILLALASCNRNSFQHDASGTFEATEVIVSAEANGKLEAFSIKEGDVLDLGQYVGYVDTVQLYLKKLQLQTSTKAANVRKPNIAIQIASVKEQIAKTETEKKRIERLLADNAATQKQMDDIDSQLTVLKKTLDAQTNTLTTSVNGLSEESTIYEIQVAQIKDQLKKSRIMNPIAGTVLNKYVEEKEVVAAGKPLYKIADVNNMYLRVYIVSEQLASLSIAKEVTIYINTTDGKQQSYKGIVSWISSKAEFTPKTIQTKDERQNLVYAVKIAVQNHDGLLKIGMYGDVDFN